MSDERNNEGNGPSSVRPSDPAVKATNDQSVINGVLGTIQISVTILSGLIIVLGVAGAFFFGSKIEDLTKEARQEISLAISIARDNSNKAEERISQVSESSIREIEKLANLYNDSIENKIDAEIGRKLRKSNSSASTLMSEMEGKFREVERELERILDRGNAALQSISTLESYEEFRSNFPVDYYGPFEIVQAKYGNRDQFVGDMEVRTEIGVAIDFLIEGALKRQVSSTALFNASALATQYDFPLRAHKLAVLSYWMEQTPHHAMRMYRQQFVTGNRLHVERSGSGFNLIQENIGNNMQITTDIREDALEKLLKVAKNAPVPNCELIYSEAWNAVEQVRRHDRLIEVLENSLLERNASGRYFPSYGHLTLAQAHARQGHVGWREHASKHLVAAEEKLENESPSSTWYDASVSELRDRRMEIRGTASSRTTSTPTTLSSVPDDELTVEELAEALDLITRIEEDGYTPTDEEEAKLRRFFEIASGAGSSE